MLNAGWACLCNRPPCPPPSFSLSLWRVFLSAVLQRAQCMWRASSAQSCGQLSVMAHQLRDVMNNVQTFYSCQPPGLKSSVRPLSKTPACLQYGVRNVQYFSFMHIEAVTIEFFHYCWQIKQWLQSGIIAPVQKCIVKCIFFTLISS